MSKLLRADMIRLRKCFALRLSLIAMFVLATFFMVMQATGMDYTVPYSRVIFLPLSMYGVVISAFVSDFVGTDFSNGFIRNKLLAVRNRSSLVLSEIMVSCVASLIVHIAVTAFTAGIGQFFFENNVQPVDFFCYFLIGACMSLAMGCLFSVITLICGRKTRAMIWCMGLAFVLLFLCLHTNEVLVQPEYKDGILNPNYVGGFRRAVCSVLHDLNPYGQISQLTSWEVWHPLRGLLWDFILIAGSTTLCCILFKRKDIE